jgi:phosphotransferase system enzyme I (PtsI)
MIGIHEESALHPSFSPTREKVMTMTIHGIAASRGIAIGPVFHYAHADLSFERCRVDDRAAEWARFERALDEAKAQLQAIHAKAQAEVGEEEAAIFNAHRMILDDPELKGAVRGAIEGEGTNAEAALQDASEMYAQALEAIDDEYLRARAADVRDVAGRVLRVLLGVTASPAEGLESPSVILARDLTPSDTALLDKSLVLGFCTVEGGATSHTAILARSLGIPAVVGAGEAVLEVAGTASVIVDGRTGELIVDPDERTVADYRQVQEALAETLGQAQERAYLPATTADGLTVEVVANIGNLQDAETAARSGAEGVGLFRTEFLYLEQTHLPGEEQQYQAYKEILEVFGTQPVILRTLDVGGDKELPYMEMPQEMNPFLGLRALRLCMAHPELFKPQLRAALRAGVGHNLKIMFPMVATVAEVRAARAVLDECRAELAAEGVETAEGMEIGIMVEIPAAALLADQLAAEIDFFSIGTNDLSQYTMAADRVNADVSYLASGFQPAVLRLVKGVIEAAHAQGKWVGMCGELAGEPLAIPLLLGLGLDEFSMNAPAVPLAKQIIRSVSQEEARALAAEALNLDSPEAIQALVRERVPAANLD